MNRQGQEVGYRYETINISNAESSTSGEDDDDDGDNHVVPVTGTAVHLGLVTGATEGIHHDLLLLPEPDRGQYIAEVRFSSQMLLQVIYGFYRLQRWMNLMVVFHSLDLWCF
jgi:hypothetical protein